MKKISVFLFLLLLIFGGVGVSYAASFSTLAEAVNGGLWRSDPKTANTGTIISKAQATPDYPLLSSASASEDGSLAVRTYASSWDIFNYYAEASWNNTYTNNSSNAIHYQFPFFVSGGQFDIYADSYHYLEFLAEYSIDILFNGSSLWNSSTKIQGVDYYTGSNTQFSQIGTDLGGSFVDNFTTDPYDYDQASYTFSPYADSIDLGIIAPGDSFTLEYIISVHTTGCDHGQANAILGDPLNLSSNPGFYGYVSAVPIPSAIWLLGSGLIGLMGVRREFKKA